MVERKLYKTKLCMLYQRGRCNRQHCNFAHGDAELRGSFNGRQDGRGRDLRERLERRHTPPRKYSMGRDARIRRASHGESPRSFGKRGDRKHEKSLYSDGHSDHSGNFKMTDGIDNHIKEKKQSSSDSKYVLDDKLRQIHSEIEMLEHEKRQLEVYLEESVREAESLNLKIQELEMQLCNEKQACQRITTKIKKFVDAHNHHLELQEELNRSSMQLQRLGEQLVLDAGACGPEDDANMISEYETANNQGVNPLGEQERNGSPRKKRPRIQLKACDTANQAKEAKVEKLVMEKTRSRKHSRKDVRNTELSNSRKLSRDSDAKRHRHLSHEDKHRSKHYLSSDNALGDKTKVSEPGVMFPSTALAAHAIDEDVEVVEIEEKFQDFGAASSRPEVEIGSKIPRLPILPPPPPPVSEKVYLQYKGDDENVDIDSVDEESVEVDIV